MRTPVSLLPILGLTLAVCLPAHAQNEAKPTAPAETKAVSTAGQLPAASAPATKAESSKSDKKALPPDMKLSAWTSEIVKLARAGIDESVMLSFIDNSGTFNLGADQIVYLSDLGLSSTVINNMLTHDREVIAGVRVLTISSDPGYEPIPGTVVAQTPSAPAKAEAATTPPSPPPAPAPTTVPAEKPSAPVASSFPNVTQLPIEPQSSAPSLVKADESLAVQPVTFSPPRVAKKNPYPTRSPYAEELLPPIIVVKAYTPTPNIIIIERFPDAKP